MAFVHFWLIWAHSKNFANVEMRFSKNLFSIRFLIQFHFLTLLGQFLNIYAIYKLFCTLFCAFSPIFRQFFSFFDYLLIKLNSF